MPQRPADGHAVTYLVGTGIASLAAAAFLTTLQTEIRGNTAQREAAKLDPGAKLNEKTAQLVAVRDGITHACTRSHH
jgi:hypothetical protein